MNWHDTFEKQTYINTLKVQYHSYCYFCVDSEISQFELESWVITALHYLTELTSLAKIVIFAVSIRPAITWGIEPVSCMLPDALLIALSRWFIRIRIGWTWVAPWSPWFIVVSQSVQPEPGVCPCLVDVQTNPEFFTQVTVSSKAHLTVKLICRICYPGHCKQKDIFDL